MALDEAEAPPPADEAREASALEERAAFLLRLREHGIRDLAVLRAMEAVPRAAFVAARHAALANRDVALPIDHGGTCPSPLSIARLLQGAALRPDMRVLEIGTGAGYATALLSRLVAVVVSLERYEPVAMATRARLAALGTGNATVLGPALDSSAYGERFDRVLIHAVLENDAPPMAWDCLHPEGYLLHARWTAADRRTQALIRASRDEAGRVQATEIGPVSLPLQASLPVSFFREIGNKQ